MSESSAVLDRPEQIAAFRLSIIIRAFKMEVETGMKLTRNVPTCRDIKAMYRLECGNTKKAVLKALLALQEQVEAGEADYELRDGICHFYPGAGS